MVVLRALLNVLDRRLRTYWRERRPSPRAIVLLVLEITGLAFFAAGILATGSFLAAETPAEAARNGVATMPTACEAGFLNHGGYTCWYTIPDHPILFALSIAVLVGGATVAWWAQRRLFGATSKREA